MKKVLLVFDGTHFSNGAFEFARCMNMNQPILLTGVFLRQVYYANLWAYPQEKNGPLFASLVGDEDTEEVQKNIDRFETLCHKNEIEYRVHKDFLGFALPELKKETRFADLVILGSESFYENLGTGKTNVYLNDALHGAECPVVIVPEQFEFPQSNILAYDGSESSVFAIKLFSYIFPEFAKYKTLLVYSDEDEERELPHIQNIEELVARHFPELSLMKLEVNPKKNFSTWIAEKKDAILVSGAFGRSTLSQLFKKSFVSGVIKDHKLPVFTTHR